MKKIFFSSRISGLSLVAVVVAMGIAGVMIAIVSSAGSNMLKAAKAIIISAEEEDLRNLIRARLDCSVTKTKIAGVTAGKRVLLYGRDEKPILGVRGDQMFINQWTVTVNGFNASRGEFDVSVEHPSRSGASKLFKAAPLACE